MKTKYPKFLVHDHTPEAIRQRLLDSKKGNLIKDFIYGGIDGIVTTFAIVAGVMGAGLPKTTILILGLSNILADGFSMAAGNYLGTKAERDQMRLFAKYEAGQIEHAPDGEREEIRQIFIKKGFSGDNLEEAVRIITQDKERWVSTMLNEEYGLDYSDKSPMSAALSTFVAFLIFGSVPLVPYLIGFEKDFTITIVFTAIAFFLLGAIKSKWSLESALSSGTKTLILGSVAAGFAYYVGYILRNYGLE